MKIQAVIAALQEIEERYGNIDVRTCDCDYGYPLVGEVKYDPKPEVHFEYSHEKAGIKGPAVVLDA